jgi:hypothetical protein
MFQGWLRAFLFTQLIEVPIYVRGLRCSWLAAFGASALTHPLVWFVFFSPRWEAGYTTKLVVAELFAWVAETAYFRLGWKKSRAWLWSLCANAASLGLGLLSRRLFGGP